MLKGRRAVFYFNCMFVCDELSLYACEQLTDREVLHNLVMQ